MTHIYLTPNWFFFYSILFEIAFSLITAFVSFYSFKIYNLTKQKEYKIFGAGFLFISASYLLWAVINSFLLDKINDGIQALTLQEFVSIGAVGICIYMFLFITGLVTITYTTLKVNNSKIYALLLIISVIAVAFSLNKALAFQLLSLVFISFLILHYFSQFNKNRDSKRFIILLAFILLFISRIQFILSTTNYIYYVIGHIFEFFAYLLVLLRLIFIKK